jgi:CheY-like chemotaxis protein
MVNAEDKFMTEPSESSVLIVDDDYFISTDVLAHHFGRFKLKVVNAYTAAEFEQKWRDAHAIVLDIRLPNNPGEPIDPWGGLRCLDKIRKGLPQGTPCRQLDKCIIRSAQTPDDAKAASVPIPTHFRWFPPDVEFSKLLAAVRTVLSSSIYSRRNQS